MKKNNEINQTVDHSFIRARTHSDDGQGPTPKDDENAERKAKAKRIPMNKRSFNLGEENEKFEKERG